MAHAKLQTNVSNTTALIFFPSLSDENSECKNEGGSFRCDCKTGFEKVRGTCKGKHGD